MKAREFFQNANIFYMEDHTFSHSMMKQALEAEGFMGELICVTSLKAAKEKINELIKAKTNIDIIFTDLHLPDGEGSQLVRAIRGHAKFKDAPLFVISTEENHLKIIECFDAGADNYFMKPIDGPKVVEKLLDVLVKRGYEA